MMMMPGAGMPYFMPNPQMMMQMTPMQQQQTMWQAQYMQQMQQMQMMAFHQQQQAAAASQGAGFPMHAAAASQGAGFPMQMPQSPVRNYPPMMPNNNMMMGQQQQQQPLPQQLPHQPLGNPFPSPPQPTNEASAVEGTTAASLEGDENKLEEPTEDVASEVGGDEVPEFDGADVDFDPPVEHTQDV